MDTKLTQIRCPIYNGFINTPDNICMYTETHNYTYKDFHKLSLHCMHHIKARYTISSHTIVTLQLSFVFDTILYFWSLLRLGVPVLIINPQSPERDCDDLMSKAESTILISNNNILECAGEFDFSENFPIYLNLNAWVHIVPTSGSSGSSKLAVLSLENYIASVNASQALIPVTNSSIWALMLPLFHVSGMSIVFRSFCNGGAISLNLSLHITHISVVETQLKRLLETQRSLLSKASYILLGGGSLSPSLLAYCSNESMPVFPTYGMTEFTSQISTHGSILSHVLVTIKNNCIWVKGESLFKGYLNHGMCTLKTDENGYFYTGDLGEIDSENRLIVKGRNDRLFISGGENVSPEEVEKAIYSCSTYSKVCVISVPDSTFQEKGIAFLDPFDEKDVFELVQKLKQQLASYKVPKEFLPLPTHLKEGKLKLSFSELKKEYIQQKELLS